MRDARSKQGRVLMQPRCAMSFMRGPMTRQEIRTARGVVPGVAPLGGGADARNGSGPRRKKAPIGKHIKLVRAFLRTTQEELGAVVDVSERSVQRWELGWTRPSGRMVNQLIAYVALRGDAAFTTDLRTLLTGERPPLAPPPPSADALMDAVREAADQLDVPASRARAAFAAFLERLETERFTVETARAAFGRVNGEGREDGLGREDRERRTEAPPGQTK